MLMLRKRTKSYGDALTNELQVADTRTLQEDLVRADEKFTRIRDALTKLGSEQPKHAAAFKRLLSFA
jgi:hypothetical protein